MKWKGRRKSDRVHDVRGQKVARTAGAGAILSLVGRSIADQQGMVAVDHIQFQRWQQFVHKR